MRNVTSLLILKSPHYFNLILGNIACAQADLLHAGVMTGDLPNRSFWSLGGIGNAQLTMNSVAIAMGGGVRVGLEDNIWYNRERTTLATNSELIHRVHRMAEANERKVMPAGKLRRLLSLKSGRGEYGTVES